MLLSDCGSSGSRVGHLSLSLIRGGERVGSTVEDTQPIGVRCVARVHGKKCRLTQRKPMVAKHDSAFLRAAYILWAPTKYPVSANGGQL